MAIDSREGWMPCHSEPVTVDLDDLDELNEVSCPTDATLRFVSFVELDLGCG
jgi:hypothetical protein